MSIALSEGVNVTQSSLTLLDSANNSIASTGFSYNSSTSIATWQFPALAADKYLINLSASSVSDLQGTALDGEWTTSISTFATGSGNGVPGGDFNFYFDVLPGDVTSSGLVTPADQSLLRQAISAPLNASNYQLDIHGSGRISNGDLLALLRLIGNNIDNTPAPQTPAATPAATPLLATPAVVSTTMVNAVAPLVAPPVSVAPPSAPIAIIPQVAVAPGPGRCGDRCRARRPGWHGCGESEPCTQFEFPGVRPVDQQPRDADGIQPDRASSPDDAWLRDGDRRTLVDRVNLRTASLQSEWRAGDGPRRLRSGARRSALRTPGKIVNLRFEIPGWFVL